MFSSPPSIAKIKEAVLDIMDVLDIDPLSLVPLEQTSTLEPFIIDCIEEARRRNYISDSPQSFREEHVRTGATLGHYAWFIPGLVSHKMAVLCSIWVGYYFCIDDFGFSLQALAEYGSRLVSGRPQLEKGLDDLNALNSELADMYHPVSGDLLRMSNQGFIMGNYLEEQMRITGTEWAVSGAAPAFPDVMKTATAAPTALYILSFPPTVPFTSYIQGLPDAIAIHNDTAYLKESSRDIMSYYKEVLADEFTRPAQIAQQRGVTGADVVGELAQSVRASHKRVVELLTASDPTGFLEACHTQLTVGFVVIQALLPRYKIRDFGIFSF
ncbi:hypothetical protein FB451DRAFT_1433570 [Mycena latifolia]|nr:hypothetical protein FB451DRAFT_1433570 [Mycena latifolia]